MKPLTHLYIEPTSHCNLQCAMCSRTQWKNEATGHMDPAVFEEILSQLPQSVTRVFFGGVGEPLCHPHILPMLQTAKDTGRIVEIITNGTLLTEDVATQLVDLQIDTVWVSLDSLEEDSYASIRAGADYHDVMQNILNFKKIRKRSNWDYKSRHNSATQLGIAFVLMKKNLHQFKKLIASTNALGITKIKATHLIPYDEEQARQICYEKLLGLGFFERKEGLHTDIDIPLLAGEDINDQQLASLLLQPTSDLSFLGMPVHRKSNYCKFVNEGYCFVRWDGEVSPCMALLHETAYYQNSTRRTLRSCSFGNSAREPVEAIWDAPDYREFRGRVEEFRFSPCVFCGPCDLFENNETDCLGNPFPACGACLWAQGLFQCP